MLTFNPQTAEVKEQGRIELATAASLSLKDAEPFFTAATYQNFQSVFNSFVDAFPKQAKAISDNRPDGVGPGEMIAYFIFDDVTLGGKNSSIDILVNNAPFAEMKGGSFTKCTNTLDNFKITKDADPAVTLILKDLDSFNATYREIKDQDLTGWRPGNISHNSLKLWESIDLLKLSKKYKGIPRSRVFIPVDPNGDVWDLAQKQRLSHLNAADLAAQVNKIALSEREIPVDNRISTLHKITSRWVDQVFIDYLEGKMMALVNRKTLRMLFFGELTKNKVGLYLVCRNQPCARIFLGET